ncbi:hypothetical protein FKM82_029365 [Ascaphus truei]
MPDCYMAECFAFIASCFSGWEDVGIVSLWGEGDWCWAAVPWSWDGKFVCVGWEGSSVCSMKAQGSLKRLFLRGLRLMGQCKYSLSILG